MKTRICLVVKDGLTQHRPWSVYCAKCSVSVSTTAHRTAIAWASAHAAREHSNYVRLNQMLRRQQQKRKRGRRG